MTKIPKLKILFLLSIFYFLDSGSASAAKFYFTGPEEVKINESFIVSARINPEDFINAIEGQIKIDTSLLELKSIADGSSVVPLWIEAPKYNGKGFVDFSGIVPGGVGPVISKESRLFDITLRAKAAGQTRISFTNYQAYLHQAQAEKASNSTEDIVINILPEEMIDSKNILVLDFELPEPFQIYVVKNKEFYDNKYVAIFSAQDKGTGMDHYETKESFLGLDGAWKRGESPYQLLDQNLFSIIEVKAVDKVGRERIEKFVPPRVVYILVIALVVLALVIIGLVYILLRRILKKSKFGGI